MSRVSSYLLAHYNGETPLGYFSRFKKMLRAAKKGGYFKESPADDLPAKSGKNKKIKQILSQEEYGKLIKTPCINHEIKKAFVVSLYTGLRWVDVKQLTWESISEIELKLVQSKTGVELSIPLHAVARNLIGEPKQGLVFKLPTADGANKILKQWAIDAGINKHITWHCARHSFSVLLQHQGTDAATVAGMLGNTSAQYVAKTYQRYVKKVAEAAIKLLPSGM